MDRLALNMYMLNNFEGQGCTQCQVGYISVRQTTSIVSCVNSSYLTERLSTFLTNTNYIENCIVYTLKEGAYFCDVCKSGFILNQNSTQCVTAINYCLRASSTASSNCIKC